MEVKKLLWQSKTFWLNLIMALISIGSIFIVLPADLHDKVPAILGSVWGVLGILLRMVTKDKVVLID